MQTIKKNQNDNYAGKLLSKFRKPQSKFAALMPLSALSLSACGGGGGGETTPVKTSTVISGSVLKGQITNALVFSDLNSNGIFMLLSLSVSYWSNPFRVRARPQS